jgi:hypothetical protein
MRVELGEKMSERQIDRMRDLYDQALETNIARAVIDRLVYCHIVTRLTNGDDKLAISMFTDPGIAEAANREIEDLDDKGQAELAARRKAEIERLSARVAELEHSLDFDAAADNAASRGRRAPRPRSHCPSRATLLQRYTATPMAPVAAPWRWLRLSVAAALAFAVRSPLPNPGPQALARSWQLARVRRERRTRAAA